MIRQCWKKYQGFSLIEVCLASALLLAALVFAAFYWYGANKTSLIQESRVALEQKLQMAMLKLKQDLRSAQKVQIKDGVMLLQLQKFVGETASLEAATITWHMTDAATLERGEENGAVTRIKFSDSSRPLNVDFKFSLAAENSVEVDFVASDLQMGQQILLRRETLSFNPAFREATP